MSEVLRYELGSGSVLVEVDEDSYGVDHPLRNEQGIVDAGRRLEDALTAVRPAAAAAVEALAELAPEHMEIQFGVKLSGAAGAIIARNSADSHFIVRMAWSAGSVPGPDEE
ncbi:CU044_2847 family protein [Arthrobacter sulfonylureivorans]|uniref:Trypsin-co-occurring domain-containing protein n=1 Tax=Arthrobacter sulfonylureivorans TaxID=2486855 RepID=A0ABY3W7E0_9MICC|nr:CU044_2847 family protein [Arthrobacter sulfonylureivorans]UNK44252.1 hypothetical protein MNQ99_09510 [Arthrobacter sulfonylureivorans]